MFRRNEFPRIPCCTTLSKRVYERLKLFSYINGRSISDILEEGALLVMKGFEMEDMQKRLKEIWKDE